MLILPGAEVPWRMGCGSGWDPRDPWWLHHGAVPAGRMQRAWAARHPRGLATSEQQQCQALGEGANLWSAGAAVERLGNAKGWLL